MSNGYISGEATKSFSKTSDEATRPVSQKLSAFLHFLHQCGHVPFDLSGRMIRPTLYEFESIPSILRPNEIKQILQVTRRDRSARGRRDYAIFTPLATYGLRAGEIVHSPVTSTKPIQKDSCLRSVESNRLDQRQPDTRVSPHVAGAALRFEHHAHRHVAPYICDEGCLTSTQTGQAAVNRAPVLLSLKAIHVPHPSKSPNRFS
jgi:hypothetical protein